MTLLVVGLGNPGPKYETTRHNAGYLVVDELVSERGDSFKLHKKTGALICELPGMIVAKPGSFMNESGINIAKLCQFFKITPDNVLVIHDELDLPFGALRLKKGGSENGHNGLKSTTQYLHTKDYMRLRFGIGRPPGRMSVVDWVLHAFSKEEWEEIPILTADCADAIKLLAQRGMAIAQNELHKNH
ncbi:MAG: aminoacyl-tRNA hydrolase [Corynebacterium sp.]|nr:aminoacyl-tRNA hydrolase [Corynebacterium sp.]